MIAINYPPDVKYPKMCSRWNGCSVNVCPLDVFNEQRHSAEGDPERTCKEHIRHRVEIIALAKSEGVEIPGGGWSKDERKKWGSFDDLAADFDRRELARKEAGLRLAGKTPDQKPPEGVRDGETPMLGAGYPEADGPEVV